MINKTIHKWLFTFYPRLQRTFSFKDIELTLWVSVQSCLTLCNPMDCGPPGSSVHEIFQARILERVAISSLRVSSQLRDRTLIPLRWQVDSLPLNHLASPCVYAGHSEHCLTQSRCLVNGGWVNAWMNDVFFLDCELSRTRTVTGLFSQSLARCLAPGRPRLIKDSVLKEASTSPLFGMVLPTSFN